MTDLDRWSYQIGHVEYLRNEYTNIYKENGSKNHMYDEISGLYNEYDINPTKNSKKGKTARRLRFS